MLIKDFTFNDIQLSSLGYTIVSFDGDMDTVMTGSHITFNSVKSANNERRRSTSVTFEDVLSTKFQIAKYDCKTEVLSNLNTQDIRQIMNWLNTHNNHKLVFLDSEDGYEDVYYLGSFNIDLIRKKSKIVGLELTFNSCLPYALSKEEISTFDVEEHGSITLYNEDDCNGYNIPKKTVITVLSEGTLTIDNSLSGLRTSISNCTENEVITINGDTLWLDVTDNNHDIHNDFNYNFIKLVKNDTTNENILTFSLPCKVEVTTEYIRKVGII